MSSLEEMKRFVQEYEKTISKLADSLVELEQEALILKRDFEERGKIFEERGKIIAELEDRLKNGIKYDEEQNQYILVWTEREIEQAKKEAAKLHAFFNKTESGGKR